MNVLLEERPSASDTSPCVEFVMSAAQMVRWRYILAKFNRELRVFYLLSKGKRLSYFGNIDNGWFEKIEKRK